jgi:hypothetical protein
MPGSCIPPIRFVTCVSDAVTREAEAAAWEQASGAAVAAAEDRRRDLESYEARTRKVGAAHAGLHIS